MHYLKNTLKALFFTTLLFFTNNTYTKPINARYQYSLNFKDEPAIRSVASFAPDGTTLELNDGSIWTVSSYFDQREVCTWYSSDPIVFIKNNNWTFFNNTTYELVNLAKACSVKANISQNAYNDTLDSYLIHAITSQGHVVLRTPGNKHVYFLISKSKEEENFVAKWLIGDSILIGRSNLNEYATTIDLTKASHILINLGANGEFKNNIKARYLGFVQYR